jgi:uncharacterized protein (DUF2252 family)
LPRAYPRLKDRSAVLAEFRNLKMASSAHAFVRGNTTKFYDWLETAPGLSVPKGPPLWICGDCHLSNLGPIADAKGNVDIQIRDFDQAVIGNPAYDLIRLGLSLATSARGSDLPGVTTAMMMEQMIEGYERSFAMTHKKASADAKIPRAVRSALRSALKRKWKQLACERLEDTEPTIPLGERFWPLSRDETQEIHALFSTEKTRRMVTSLRSRDDDADVKVLDAAYWMKGCSSLGRLRYAVLLEVGGKKGDLCLMDIKEAVAPVPPHDAKAKMPRDHAKRVVEGACHLSPGLGNRMLAARFGKHAVFVRELRPQDLKLDIEHLTREQAMRAARFLAVVVGMAHARQMDETTRKEWRLTLERSRAKKREAPSWLWSSVVELMGRHETAYLEHCRKYVMEGATH